jgi:hypothetical protein
LGVGLNLEGEGRVGSFGECFEGGFFECWGCFRRRERGRVGFWVFFLGVGFVLEGVRVRGGGLFFGCFCCFRRRERERRRVRVVFLSFCCFSRGERVFFECWSCFRRWKRRRVRVVFWGFFECFLSVGVVFLCFCCFVVLVGEREG